MNKKKNSNLKIKKLLKIEKNFYVNSKNLNLLSHKFLTPLINVNLSNISWLKKIKFLIILFNKIIINPSQKTHLCWKSTLNLLSSKSDLLLNIIVVDLPIIKLLLNNNSLNLLISSKELLLKFNPKKNSNINIKNLNLYHDYALHCF